MKKSFELNRWEKAAHLLKSFSVGDIGIIDKIFSFAIYTDKRINTDEYEAFIRVLAGFFITNELDSDDKFSFIVEQVAINLENYSNDFQKYINDKNEVLKFIVENDRKDIAHAIYSVYVGDKVLSDAESSVVQYLVDNLNIQF